MKMSLMYRCTRRLQSSILMVVTIRTLKGQYQSMRPLIPKKPVDDPNGFIEETLAYYGPVLGAKETKIVTKGPSSLSQKEAIELQELVGAYTNYTSVTAGNMSTTLQPISNNPKLHKS